MLCIGDDEGEDDVEDEPRETSTEEAEGCIAHAYEGRVNVEILGDTCAYACDHFVVGFCKFLFHNAIVFICL